LTQDVHQYPSYLPPGVNMSSMHWSHVAMSGGIIPEREPLPLSSMRNVPGKGPGSGKTSILSIRAIGGPRDTAARNSSNLSPKAWISTSLPLF